MVVQEPHGCRSNATPTGSMVLNSVPKSVVAGHNLTGIPVIMSILLGIVIQSLFVYGWTKGSQVCGPEKGLIF